MKKPLDEREDVPLVGSNNSKQKKLTRQEINKGLQDIEDIMPLRDKVEMRHISSIFNMCYKKKHKNFRHSLKFAMLEEIGLKMPKSEEELL